jgi:hypothetical protein
MTDDSFGVHGSSLNTDIHFKRRDTVTSRTVVSEVPFDSD